MYNRLVGNTKHVTKDSKLTEIYKDDLHKMQYICPWKPDSAKLYYICFEYPVFSALDETIAFNSYNHNVG